MNVHGKLRTELFKLKLSPHWLFLKTEVTVVHEKAKNKPKEL